MMMSLLPETTTTTTTEWLWLLLSLAVTVVVMLITALIVTGWHQVILSLLRLLDLLLTVKFTAKRIIAQTSTQEQVSTTTTTDSKQDAAKYNNWTMADTFDECCARYSNNKTMKTTDFCVMTDGEGRRTMTWSEAEQASSVVARHVVTQLQLQQQSPTTIDDTTPNNTNGNANKKKQRPIVAIFMPSSCEFVVAMFGLIRAGIPAALLNTSLRGASLAHALTAALAEDNADATTTSNGTTAAQHANGTNNSSSNAAAVVGAVLVSPELAPVLQTLQAKEPKLAGIPIVICGSTSTTGKGQQCDLDPWQQDTDTASPQDSWKETRSGVTWDDTAVYIYTSGTTGFPKASKINHLRMWTAGCVTRKVCGLTARDRLYCPLPLYHASGCTLGLVATLQAGGTIVLRSKFSASKFSHDVVQYQCNSCQYIGEMCRYLVAAKPDPQYDGVQPLRFAYGNGMPVEVWEPFQKRYNVQQVNEFYAATEGNVNIFNNTGKAVGACGIVPRGFEWLYPIGLFQHDPETGELIRDATTGLCVPVQRGQTGELLGLIQQNDPSRRFDGYSNRQATERKIVRNVCKPGDAYFRSGDLLRQDGIGFLYFCDRVGDTFRWKGENVSTSEVARALLECGSSSNTISKPGASSSLLPLFSEAIVFGVEVPKNPGRAGMATVVMAPSSSSTNDWQADLWQALQHELPRYAQPLFLRVTDEIEKTSTQKYKKTQLQKESFEDCGTDLVYLRDDTERTFVVLTDKVKQAVLSGTKRV